MKFFDILRFITAIITIITILLSYYNIIEKTYLILPILLIVVELIKFFTDVYNEKRAKLIEKTITDIHNDVHKVQIDTEILKDDVDTSVDEILEEVKIKNKYDKTRKLITKLIEKGYLKERVVYNIIKPRTFFFIFTYNDPPAKDLKEYLPNKRQLILEIIENIGFIKLGKRHSFYMIIPETLKKKFRDIEQIRNYIINKFQREVKKIKTEIKTKDKRLYEKIENEDDEYILNYTFIISSANLTDLSMEYFPFNSFSKRFKEYLNGSVNLKQLKKETVQNRHDIKKFVLSISNELLLDTIPLIDKENIILNEENLKSKLKVVQFTDYSNIPIDELKKELYFIFNDIDKAKKYSEIIVNNSKEYSILLQEMGISF